MAKTKINKNIVKTIILAPKVKEAVYNSMVLKVEDAKKEMINDFNNHPVTLEIEGGETAENISNTLNGVKGNLFSFIGFEKGTKPTLAIREALMIGTRILPIKKVKINQYTVQYKADIILPSKDELSMVAIRNQPSWLHYPWIYAIEHGVSGIRFFLYKFGIRKEWLKKRMEKIYNSASRSGTGVQIDLFGGRIGARFKNISYISSILNKFKSKFNQ